MKPLATIRLFLISAGILLGGVITSYALGAVSGRTARILLFCGLAAFLIVIAIGVATGRLSFYMIRRGSR